MKLRNLPTRVATGAFVLHSGLGKWKGGPEQAAGVHGMAAGAIPPLQSVDAPTFLKVLSASEVAIGAVLLAPFVSNRKAGVALTAFSGGLMAMYARTPALREPGSIWPSQQGIGVAKDVWMLGIGLGLLLDPANRKPKAVAA
ncbi:MULTISPECIES: hypothetical protein [unclassified Nocardioides]|uniref:hypothetical protein n=1 Tax=unclassified Nocardioides TaxID=2615069 RepID=UPI0009F03D7F|nr:MULTISPECIES: hypothetical protein [unclassified Nocardioides]GAW52083.1 uncharacterized protein PD653B2_4433 [Nocardioides sp. PD653-B2]GAW57186.1 uncharacterized protein PD653_4629 [Nocardioides sp. PD653]